ncbi:MAG: 50S ribosomal protein L4 [Desulfovibrionaceae bacterium]|nr:50S ribosomal protein L4 [Desulfovibrionaceae bacterium]
MATVKVYDQQKQESGELQLPPEIFEVEVKPEVVHLVVRAQLAARRAGTHSAKTRAYVSGGGSKPWKQKGTGRARSGSNRSPVWRGGAIVFGPTPRSYVFKVNRKVRQKALAMALSARVSEDKLMVLKGIELPEAKTKHFAKMLKQLELSNALFVLPKESASVERAAHNLQSIKVITADKLNVLDVVTYKELVLLEPTVGLVTQRFASKEA